MNFRGGKKTIKCKKCDKEFSVYPGNKTRVYCSRKCSGSDKDRTVKMVNTRKSNGNSFKNENDKLAITRFNQYKGISKRKNRRFDFLKDTFVNKILQKCNYCGEENAFGLDRLNSAIGYTEDNTVPCCSKCNYAKNTMSELEFKKHITKIYQFYARK